MLLMWKFGEGGGQEPIQRVQTQHTNVLMSLWVLEEEGILLTASLDGHVKVWDTAGNLQNDHLVTNQNNQPSGVTSIAVIPEQTPQGEVFVLVTACDDKVSTHRTSERFSARPSCPSSCLDPACLRPAASDKAAQCSCRR